MAIVVRRKYHEHVLGFGPSERQPVFALDLLPTKDHTRTGTVPLDGGDLVVVSVREQLRAPRVAPDRVEWLASRVGHDGIDNLRAAARKFELNRGSLDVAGCVDQCCAQRSEGGRRAAMVVTVWVSARRYLCSVNRRSGHGGGTGEGEGGGE